MPPDARGSPQQQVPSRPIRPVTFDPVGERPTRRCAAGSSPGLRTAPRCPGRASEGGRCRPSRGTQDDLVDCSSSIASTFSVLPGRRIDAAAPADLVLLRREAIAERPSSDPTGPISSSDPIGSRSSSRSSSVRSCSRWKYRHHAGLSSRRCQPSSWASSHRPCCSRRTRGLVLRDVRPPTRSATVSTCRSQSASLSDSLLSLGSGAATLRRGRTAAPRADLRASRGASRSRRRRLGCTARSGAGSHRPRPTRRRPPATSRTATIDEPASRRSTSRS